MQTRLRSLVRPGLRCDSKRRQFCVDSRRRLSRQPGRISVAGKRLPVRNVFNAWPPPNSTFVNDMEKVLVTLGYTQQNWPSHDLFPRYYPED